MPGCVLLAEDKFLKKYSETPLETVPPPDYTFPKPVFPSAFLLPARRARSGTVMGSPALGWPLPTHS